MPVSLEKTERWSVPGVYTEDQVRVELGFPTRAQLRTMELAVTRVRQSVGRMVPAVSVAARSVAQLTRALQAAQMAEGADLSVSPDAMRWTPSEGEVPRWPV